MLPKGQDNNEAHVTTGKVLRLQKKQQMASPQANGKLPLIETCTAREMVKNTFSLNSTTQGAIIAHMAENQSTIIFFFPKFLQTHNCDEGMKLHICNWLPHPFFMHITLTASTKQVIQLMRISLGPLCLTRLITNPRICNPTGLIVMRLLVPYETTHGSV